MHDIRQALHIRTKFDVLANEEYRFRVMLGDVIVAE